MMNASSRRALALLTALAVSACNAVSPLKWTEDVKLPDGRVVTLTRYQEFKGPHELGDQPTDSDYWFEFKHPDTGQVVRWQSDRDLETLALLMDGAVPLLLVTPHFGTSFNRYNCPNPPYLLFRYESAWKQISIDQIPVKKIQVNMTFAPRDSRKKIEASNFHLSAEQTINSHHNYRSYLINFDLMKRQTFGIANCGHQPDELISK